VSRTGCSSRRRAAAITKAGRRPARDPDQRVDTLVGERLGEHADKRRGILPREVANPVRCSWVFLFEGPTTSSFWMKDTLIPLSIAFWDGDETIVEILDMEPCEADPCPTYGPRVPYVGAVEVNEGWFARNRVDVGEPVELRT